MAGWLHGVAGDPLVLDLRQSRLLWREIVAASPEASALIDTRSVAEWARRAALLLLEHDVDVETLARHDGSIESRALHQWARTYRDALAARGWLDAGGVASLVATSGGVGPARAVRLLDCDDLTPLRERCFVRLIGAGWQLVRVPLPTHAGAARRVAAACVTEEIGRASEWVIERSAAAPGSLIALVVPPGYAPAGLLERLLGDAPAVTFGAAHPPVGMPAIAAACNALTLLTRDGGVLELSHWLRSPFFQGQSPDGAGAAARLEAELRDELMTQLPFRVAYRDGGLAERMRERAPALAARIDRALGRIGDVHHQRSPSRWTEIWRACLRELDWRAEPEAHATRSLDVALAELAKLTAVTPRMSLDRALDELRSILAEPLLMPRMPFAGIHVLEHIDEVGPGYAAVWAVGFSAAAWPERSTPNPLLPRPLQARHGMPWSSPDDALARSKRSIARVCAVAPEVRLSWSERELDAPRLASPLIAALEPAALAPVARIAAHVRSVDVDMLADVPPPLAGGRIPGGAATLNQQARCPLRAFAERRLGAKPLSAWTRGVTPRLRGTLTHAAAELLLPVGTTQAALAGLSPTLRARRIDSTVSRALDRTFGRLRLLLRVIYSLERERLARLLHALVEAELERADFEVIATESRAAIELAGREVHARLDRIDRLPGLGIAIVDYKTGAAAGAPEWFGARIGDVQVPLYACHAGAELTAAVLCQLRPDGARYRGYWAAERDFPGASENLPEGLSWLELRARWRAALGELVASFAAGDVRIRLDDTSDAEGVFAPLSRVYELIDPPRAGPAQ